MGGPCLPHGWKPLKTVNSHFHSKLWMENRREPPSPHFTAGQAEAGENGSHLIHSFLFIYYFLILILYRNIVE